MRYAFVILIAASIVNASDADKAEKAFLQAAESQLERGYAVSAIQQVQNGMHLKAGWPTIDQFMLDKSISHEVRVAYYAYKRAVRSDKDYIKRINAEKFKKHLDQLEKLLASGKLHDASFIINYYQYNTDIRFLNLHVTYVKAEQEHRKEFDSLCKSFRDSLDDGDLKGAKTAYQLLADYKLYAAKILEIHRELSDLQSYDKHVTQAEKFIEIGHLKAANNELAKAIRFIKGGKRTDAISKILDKKLSEVNKKADRLVRALESAIKSGNLKIAQPLMAELQAHNRLNGEHPKYKELRQLLKDLWETTRSKR